MECAYLPVLITLAVSASAGWWEPQVFRKVGLAVLAITVRFTLRNSWW
jgi:hypothetical protein